MYVHSNPTLIAVLVGERVPRKIRRRHAGQSSHNRGLSIDQVSKAAV